MGEGNPQSDEINVNKSALAHGHEEHGHEVHGHMG